MKRYHTMITEDYVPDWRCPDGIREYVANGLDGSAPFKYIIGEDFIELISEGINLDISCFLLGVSKNRSNSSAVGKHGEGSLVGMVPILREGATITIYNGDVIWKPQFEMDHNFNKEVLVINETSEYFENSQDYRIVIGNLSQDCINEVVANCLYLQDESTLGKHSTAKCGSRVFWEKKGSVYVGGLFVTRANLDYSYDFHPSKLPLNRDRKSVDTWNLNTETSRLLKEVGDPQRIVDLAKKGANDISHLQYGWSVSNSCVDILQKSLRERSAFIINGNEHV